MTRIRKIYFLLSEGEIIDYHYNNYTYQRRLIIDRINKWKFLNTSSDQKLAAKMIDSMYEEYYNRNDQKIAAKMMELMI